MSKDSLTVRQLSGNLNFSTAQKMVHKLLTSDRIKTELDEGRVINYHRSRDDRLVVKTGAYTKEELAKKLDISPKDLKKLKSPGSYSSIVRKISLSLIRLYCATKFVDGKCKGRQI